MDTITRTETRVDEIRDRLDAATPGQWTAAVVDSPRASVTTAIYTREFPTGTPESVVLPSYPIRPGSPRLSRANAELIAHATTDLEWLLNEVTRLNDALNSSR